MQDTAQNATEEWAIKADEAAEQLKNARLADKLARQNAKQVALEALEANAAEAAVARRLGVDRMTIRSWRGTRTR